MAKKTFITAYFISNSRPRNQNQTQKPVPFLIHKYVRLRGVENDNRIIQIKNDKECYRGVQIKREELPVVVTTNKGRDRE